MRELFGFPIIKDPNLKPSTIEYILGGTWEDFIIIVPFSPCDNCKREVSEDGLEAKYTLCKEHSNEQRR